MTEDAPGDAHGDAPGDAPGDTPGASCDYSTQDASTEVTRCWTSL